MAKKFSIFILTLLFSACYYDNVDEMHPEIGLVTDCDPDTTTVTYTKDIKALLLANCGSDNSGCHQAGNIVSEISLATYDDVSAVASTGQLLGAILHEPNYAPMPSIDDQLSDCKINKVKAWINQGMIE